MCKQSRLSFDYTPACLIRSSTLLACMLASLWMMPYPAQAAGVFIDAPPFQAEPTQPSPTPLPEQPQVTSPLGGQALQGNVPILGTTLVDGFISYEITFAYANNPTGTWFLIQFSTLPVVDASLAYWDTTLITDGDYTLRLIVTQSDGNQITLFIQNLRVRNYTPIETDTPTPLAAPSLTPLPGQAAETPIPSVTPTASATLIAPTPTPLPTNPAIVTSADYLSNLTSGALVALVAFIMIGLYLGIQRLRR